MAVPTSCIIKSSQRKTVPSHRQERHGRRTESGVEWAYQGKTTKKHKSRAGGRHAASKRPPATNKGGGGGTLVSPNDRPTAGWMAGKVAFLYRPLGPASLSRFVRPRSLPTLTEPRGPLYLNGHQAGSVGRCRSPRGSIHRYPSIWGSGSPAICHHEFKSRSQRQRQKKKKGGGKRRRWELRRRMSPRWFFLG